MHTRKKEKKNHLNWLTAVKTKERKKKLQPKGKSENHGKEFTLFGLAVVLQVTGKACFMSYKLSKYPIGFISYYPIRSIRT